MGASAPGSATRWERGAGGWIGAPSAPGPSPGLAPAAGLEARRPGGGPGGMVRMRRRATQGEGSSMPPGKAVITFCLDVGGTGIKGITVDEEGRPTAERVRLPTPQPAEPAAVLATAREIAGQMPPFDRVAAGFPGVVVEGTVHTAPNLGAMWAGFPLAEALQDATSRPARVANDAGVQGLAAIEGRGTELVITLGTGMGFALYIDGHYVPNLEMVHHVFRKHRTYEERVGNRALQKVGRRRWNKRVLDAIQHLEPVFN